MIYGCHNTLWHYLVSFLEDSSSRMMGRLQPRQAPNKQRINIACNFNASTRQHNLARDPCSLRSATLGFGAPNTIPCPWRREPTATALGIDRMTLYTKMRASGLL